MHTKHAWKTLSSISCVIDKRCTRHFISLFLLTHASFLFDGETSSSNRKQLTQLITQKHNKSKGRTQRTSPFLYTCWLRYNNINRNTIKTTCSVLLNVIYCLSCLRRGEEGQQSVDCQHNQSLPKIIFIGTFTLLLFFYQAVVYSITTASWSRYWQQLLL